MKKLYTAVAVTTGGRDGHVKPGNGALDIEVKSPVKLGGKTDDYPNPEMLFAAGYAACFGSALDSIISKRKITTGTTTVKAEVSLGKLNENAYGLAVKLDVTIPGVEQVTADELVKTAHHVCPYSNAIRGNVEVELNATIE